MDFELGQSQRELRELARAWVDPEVVPHAAAWDLAGTRTTAKLSVDGTRNVPDIQMQIFWSLGAWPSTPTRCRARRRGAPVTS